MHEKTSEQAVQHVQAPIESFFGQALDSMQKIEYKPQFITPLLGLSSERRQNELIDTMAINNNFSRQGGGK